MPDASPRWSFVSELPWKLAKFSASLKLAVILIIAMASLLAVATLYEARYGTPAAQMFIYGSGAFLALMGLLAINVAAAVFIRYPWRKAQIGFIITHVGIEVLLAGCLLSFYSSTEGYLTLDAGESGSTLRLSTGRIKVEYSDGKEARTLIIPAELWREAGYPGVAGFAASLFGGAIEPRWPAGRKLTHQLGEGLKLEILDWLPAAKIQERFVPDPHGPAAMKITIGGMLTDGQGVNNTAWFSTGEGGQSAGELAGKIMVSTWRARCSAEMDDFLHPPTELGKMGLLSILIGDKVQRVPIDGNIGQNVPIDGGYVLRVEKYFPQLNVGPQGLVSTGEEPTNPALRLSLTKGNDVQSYAVFAKFPQLMMPLDGDGHRGARTADLPMIYHHAGIYGKNSDPDAGQVQLMQSIDGKLWARFITPDGLKPAFEAKAGQDYPMWGGLTLSMKEYVPNARFEREVCPAQVSPANIGDAMRAVKVAMDSDGQRVEQWAWRGDAPVRFSTPRGMVTVSYEYDTRELDFEVKLIDAGRTNDPGTDSAATFWSRVDVKLASGETARTNAEIAMNEPLTVNGITLYQSSMREDPMRINNGKPMVVSTLSARRDPGTVLKYVGSVLLIVGMCFLRPYLQKPRSVGEPGEKPRATQTPLPRAVGNNIWPERPRAMRSR